MPCGVCFVLIISEQYSEQKNLNHIVYIRLNLAFVISLYRAVYFCLRFHMTMKFLYDGLYMNEVLFLLFLGYIIY